MSKKVKISVAPKLNKKKKSTKKRQKSPPKKQGFVLSPYVPPEKKKNVEKIEVTKITPEKFQQVVNTVARCENWNDTKLVLEDMKRYYLSYSEIAQLLHRIPSVAERIKAGAILQKSLKDVQTNYFLFIQSFASKQERDGLEQIYSIEQKEDTFS
ncbi:hypothetical protein TVAG_413100 [Trichomonas vaginalis G3]|uniref:DUF4476 domain-containing protein n=1 Tax=Trichomonas vaginalis (strain ATCC PRA-98 / G3) TaxID=412133 RepID=A2F6J4_TRIV3|nr:protein of unknown function (DUF4476) family [Trichomonas vaginalis G3]EAX99492.1 hypothetical protein TVAG_413100 [Trichomonas vaginalis G3]KAI5538684.1 protein of unknown function (DUF4476) family [Trichomonas vaginalis G3]|eukprot:XP_001312422.1 hypothetical protein [Trichomonas vaginalis G3]